MCVEMQRTLRVEDLGVRHTKEMCPIGRNFQSYEATVRAWEAVPFPGREKGAPKAKEAGRAEELVGAGGATTRRKHPSSACRRGGPREP